MDQSHATTELWCPTALLPGGWASDVMVSVDESGNISNVRSEVPAGGATQLKGTVIPGIPNLHSHAHQRAMAGLGERSGSSEDSFWTWREVMYRHLRHIEPHHLHALAAQLYIEMLKAGYTSVAEFQYLHHDLHGNAYENRAEMTLQCLSAASDAGIGFTALPVLYRYGGFGEQEAAQGQRRFLNDADGFLRIVENVSQACAENPNATVGMAPHSIRAISVPLLAEVQDGLDGAGVDLVHIHSAETLKEVEDCNQWSGQTPVAWLFDNANVNENWCLIHATHMSADETKRLATSGAVAGLCPTTEANLGDGFFNAPEYLSSGGLWGLGSDSHISISPVEELRWLEYGHRLTSNRRTVLAGGANTSTARTLLQGCLKGGAQACGRKIGSIAVSYRADFLVLDEAHPLLYGRQEDSLLDSWVFSGNANAVRDVYVGGKAVIQNGYHAREAECELNFKKTINKLAKLL